MFLKGDAVMPKTSHYASVYVLKVSAELHAQTRTDWIAVADRVDTSEQ